MQSPTLRHNTHTRMHTHKYTHARTHAQGQIKTHTHTRTHADTHTHTLTKRSIKHFFPFYLTVINIIYPNNDTVHCPLTYGDAAFGVVVETVPVQAAAGPTQAVRALCAVVITLAVLHRAAGGHQGCDTDTHTHTDTHAHTHRHACTHTHTHRYEMNGG